MIWRITERQVVYQLVKMRRKKSPNRRWVGNTYYSSNLDDYIRQTYGIEKDLFADILFSEEFKEYWLNKWLVRLYIKLRPVYFEFFHNDIKEAVESCINNSYIKSTNHNSKNYIKDTEKGRKLLSFCYFLRKLTEYEPIRDLIGKILKVMVITFLGYVGISAILN